MKILTKTTSVRFPSSLYDGLTKLSKVANKHPSQLIRESIEQFITQQKHSIERIPQ